MRLFFRSKSYSEAKETSGTVHDGAPEAVDLSHQHTIELCRQPFPGSSSFTSTGGSCERRSQL